VFMVNSTHKKTHLSMGKGRGVCRNLCDTTLPHVKGGEKKGEGGMWLYLRLGAREGEGMTRGRAKERRGVAVHYPWRTKQNRLQ